MTRQHTAVWGGALLIVAIAATVSIRAVTRRPGAIEGVPTARVQRGAVDVNVFADGELRTPRTAMIVAPPIGGTLQIVYLVPAGTAVKKDEVVVEFDPSEQEYSLEQSQSQLAEADQQIAKARADAAVQAAQDKVALLKARFDVRRAELETGKNELLAEIDARKNVMALTEAKRRLAQLETDVASRKVSTEAGVAVLQQRREQSRLSMQRARIDIDNMKVKAPMDGIVSVRENPDAFGGMYFGGMSMPEYRQGDQVSPGRMVAEVLDLGRLELNAKVKESDRGNVISGSQVDIQIDAAPGKHGAGQVKTIAGLASRGMWSVDTVRTFDVTVELGKSDIALRPAQTAHLVIRGPSLQGKLFLPRQCLFEKDGRPVIYVKDGNGFRAEDAKILNQTESQVTLEGIAEGTEVALLDPAARKTTSANGAKPAKPAAGGVSQ